VDFVVRSEAGHHRVRAGLTPLGNFVYTTSIGMLVCEKCTAGWCPHIHDAITRGRDSDSIWMNLIHNRVHTLRVPVIPNDWCIFARVLLEDTVDPDKRVLKAYILNPTGKPPTGMEFLGLICRGDGRLQLRQMIIDWLETLVITRPMGCKSLRHTSKVESETVEACIQDKRTLLAHAWCLHWYNKCAGCTLVEGPEPEFDPALVPDL
jgi:hypothetical protein